MKVLFCCCQHYSPVFKSWHVLLIPFKANAAPRIPFSFCWLFSMVSAAAQHGILYSCSSHSVRFCSLLFASLSISLRLSSFIQFLDSYSEDTHSCWGCCVVFMQKSTHLGAWYVFALHEGKQKWESSTTWCVWALYVLPRSLGAAGQHLHIHLVLLSGWHKIESPYTLKWLILCYVNFTATKKTDIYIYNGGIFPEAQMPNLQCVSVESGL